jgi:hypothetical protein
MGASPSDTNNVAICVSFSPPANPPPSKAVDRSVVTTSSDGHKLGQVRADASLIPLRCAEWRGPRSYLVGGFERNPAPIQKQAEHIEPADHKHDLARDRLTVLV